MFNEKSLKELASVEASGPILSVYLDVDPTQRNTDEYKLKLREMLKQIEHEVDDDDIQAVKRYVDMEYDWSGRGLAMFTRQADDFWLAIPLSVPVRSGVTVAQRPYIAPLVELNGLYGRYVVASVDRQGGHFYLFHMGDLIEHEGVMGLDVRRTRKGRGSSVVGMRGGAPASGRKEAEVVQRNLKEIADALTNFCQKHRPRRLILAGSEHTLAQFREQLPSSLQNIVAGSFSAEMDAGEVEIRDRTLAILETLDKQRKDDLVEAVITASAKGMNGVVGLDETLSAANEGRVQVLVVERDFHRSGYRCGGCGYLTTQPMETCIFCEGTFMEVPDAAEAVVSQVVEKGGTVEVVEDGEMNSASIGALLRY